MMFFFSLLKLPGDPEAFTVQVGYVVPLVFYGSTYGSPPSLTRPDYSPDQMPRTTKQVNSLKSLNLIIFK